MSEAVAIDAKSIVQFCRFAREQGLSVGVQKTLLGLRAAAVLGAPASEDFKSGLRTALCSNQEEWESFDGIFDAFWHEAGSGHAKRQAERRSARATDHNPQSSGSLMSGVIGSEESEPGGSQEIAGASARERLRKADFSTLRQDDLSALEEIALRLLRQMSLRLSRRRRIANLRGRVDLRRTIRSSISRGGEPIDLRYQDRRPRPPRLVILLDISGSMSAYSLFLVRFAYALQKYFQRVDTFLFSTSLVDVTRILHSRRLPAALQALSQIAAGWSGGTKIGGSLAELNRLHGRKLHSGDTLFIILSDGWDTGSPELLAAELAAVKRRVRKLIWLNPLLGLAEYRPLTQGMSAALPHVDVFAAAHNLESLLQLERHL